MFLPQNCSLIHGNELLGESDPSYGETTISRYRQTAHTLEAVWDALDQSACELPLNWSPPAKLKAAGEVFTGYLMLDALVGNTDRHHENWGIVEAPEEATARRHLAPTYDHASWLGCHLSDGERMARIRTRDIGYGISTYARRARSALFEHPLDPQPMTTIHAFRKGAARWTQAADVWMDALAGVTESSISATLTRIPPHRLSDASRDFALKMLLHNKERLLSVTS